MVILDIEQMEVWLRKRGIQTSTNGKSMHYTANGAFGFMVRIPEQIGGIHLFLGSILPDFEVSCQSSLVWVSERGIWSPILDIAGSKLVRQMCVSYGQYPSFDGHLRFLFDPTEDLDAHAMLSVILVSGWDAYFVPSHGKRFVFFSHDSVADVVARSRDIAQEYKPQVSQWDISDGVPEYLMKP